MIQTESQLSDTASGDSEHDSSQSPPSLTTYWWDGGDPIHVYLNRLVRMRWHARLMLVVLYACIAGQLLLSGALLTHSKIFHRLGPLEILMPVVLVAPFFGSLVMLLWWLWRPANLPRMLRSRGIAVDLFMVPASYESLRIWQFRHFARSLMLLSVPSAIGYFVLVLSSILAGEIGRTDYRPLLTLYFVITALTALSCFAMFACALCNRWLLLIGWPTAMIIFVMVTIYILDRRVLGFLGYGMGPFLGLSLVYLLVFGTGLACWLNHLLITYPKRAMTQSIDG